jgi:hypothetical protein
MREEIHRNSPLIKGVRGLCFPFSKGELPTHFEKEPKRKRVIVQPCVGMTEGVSIARCDFMDFDVVLHPDCLDRSGLPIIDSIG